MQDDAGMCKSPRWPTLHWKVLLQLTLLAPLTPIAFADAPPSWRPFEVCAGGSEGEPHYCARVERTGSGQRVEQAQYHLKVERIGPQKERTPFWQREYKYDGYPSGLLSPDGETFVYVNYWYAPKQAVVSVYAKQSVYSLTGEQFEIATAKLRKTASHKLWLAEPGNVQGMEFISAKRLSLRTIDDTHWVLDLRDGCHLYRREDASAPSRWKECVSD